MAALEPIERHDDFEIEELDEPVHGHTWCVSGHAICRRIRLFVVAYGAGRDQAVRLWENRVRLWSMWMDEAGRGTVWDK